MSSLRGLAKVPPGLGVSRQPLGSLGSRRTPFVREHQSGSGSILKEETVLPTSSAPTTCNLAPSIALPTSLDIATPVALDETRVMSTGSRSDLLVDTTIPDGRKITAAGNSIVVDTLRSELKLDILEELKGDLMNNLMKYQQAFDSSLAAQAAQISEALAEKGREALRIDALDTKLDLSISKLEAAIRFCSSHVPSQTESASSEQKRLADELEDKMKERFASFIEADLTTLREEVESMRRAAQNQAGDSSGDWSLRCHEIDGLREEIKRLWKELSDEKVERARSITGVCNHAEEVVQHGLNTIWRKDGGKEESMMKQLPNVLKKLDAMTQERGEMIRDIGTLRGELEDVMSRTAELRNTVGSMKSVSEIMGNDTLDLRTLLQEMRTGTQNDLSNLTSGLSSLSETVESIQFSRGGQDERDRHIDEIRKDTADLRTVLQEIRVSTQTDIVNLTGAFSNLVETVNGIRAGNSREVAVDTSQIDQIRSDTEDLSTQLHEMRTSTDAEILHIKSSLSTLAEAAPLCSSKTPASVDGRLQTLEIDAANKTQLIQGRLDEIFALNQVMAQGTEKLGKRLQSETAMWKSAKLQNDLRLSRIEKYMNGGQLVASEGSVGKESSDTLETLLADTPSLMSKDLKHSLEHLVTRLTKSLQPESDGLVSQDAAGRRGNYTGVREAASRDLSPLAPRGISRDVRTYERGSASSARIGGDITSLANLQPRLSEERAQSRTRTHEEDATQPNIRLASRIRYPARSPEPPPAHVRMKLLGKPSAGGSATYPFA